MRRDWNHLLGPQGSGQRFAQALGCVSTQSYVQSVIAIQAGLLEGQTGQLIADRAKVDAAGNELDDHKKPGDYVTIGYRFAVGEEEWQIERGYTFEGERAAEDYSDALGLAGDRGFCEAMLQAKAALDRFGGQLFVKPVAQNGEIVGLVYRYEHLVRGQIPEPDAEPLPDPGAEPMPEAETPEQMHDELEEERPDDDGGIRDEIEAEAEAREAANA